MQNNTGSINITLPPLEFNATLKSRANFSHYHLNSAKLSFYAADKIEQEYKNQKDIPPNILNDYMSYVSTSIICSVAALESKINECIVDRKAQLSKIFIPKSSIIFKKYKNLNPKKVVIEQINSISNALVKCDIVAFLLQNKLLSTDSLFKKIKYLIDMRNSLIHFTPEWDNALIKHKNLKDKYQKQFSDDFILSPFFNEDALFIPYCCLSASCAKWACKNSIDFIETYFLSITTG